MRDGVEGFTERTTPGFILSINVRLSIYFIQALYTEFFLIIHTFFTGHENN